MAYDSSIPSICSLIFTHARVLSYWHTIPHFTITDTYALTMYIQSTCGTRCDSITILLTTRCITHTVDNVSVPVLYYIIYDCHRHRYTSHLLVIWWYVMGGGGGSWVRGTVIYFCLLPSMSVPLFSGWSPSAYVQCNCTYTLARVVNMRVLWHDPRGGSNTHLHIIS